MQAGANWLQKDINDASSLQTVFQHFLSSTPFNKTHGQSTLVVVCFERQNSIRQFKSDELNIVRRWTAICCFHQNIYDDKDRKIDKYLSRIFRKKKLQRDSSGTTA